MAPLLHYNMHMIASSILEFPPDVSATRGLCRHTEPIYVVYTEREREHESDS